MNVKERPAGEKTVNSRKKNSLFIIFCCRDKHNPLHCCLFFSLTRFIICCAVPHRSDHLWCDATRRVIRYGAEPQQGRATLNWTVFFSCVHMQSCAHAKRTMRTTTDEKKTYTRTRFNAAPCIMLMPWLLLLMGTEIIDLVFWIDEDGAFFWPKSDHQVKGSSLSLFLFLLSFSISGFYALGILNAFFRLCFYWNTLADHCSTMKWF